MTDAAWVTVWVDGLPVQTRSDRSLAACVTAANPRVRTSPAGDRGIFCGMGSCLDCRVTVDGATVLACLTPVTPGMRVVTRAQESDHED